MSNRVARMLLFGCIAVINFAGAAMIALIVHLAINGLPLTLSVAVPGMFGAVCCGIVYQLHKHYLLKSWVLMTTLITGSIGSAMLLATICFGFSNQAMLAMTMGVLALGMIAGITALCWHAKR